MPKRKTIEELISEFDSLLIATTDERTNIGLYEVLRHVDGPAPKGKEQKRFEKSLKIKLALMRILKDEISQRLGVETDAAKNKYRWFF